MPGVSVVGSGNLGANTAFFIAETCPTDVILHDLKEGMSTGKALDMMEAAPLRRYKGRLAGADSIEAVKGSRVVVIAAGAIRAPGASRESLYAENAEIVRSLASEVARLAPDSIVVVGTEPVDALTMLFVSESKFPRTRVLGLGGMLDSARLRNLVSRRLGLSAENISALVVGRHSDEMIAPAGYTRVGGVPIEQLLSKAEFEALEEETRRRGGEIVRLGGRSNAYYAPGACAAELVEAVVGDLHRVFPVSFVLDGEQGISGAALSLPAVIGAQGVERALAVHLSPEQTQRLSRSAADLQALVGGQK